MYKIKGWIFPAFYFHILFGKSCFLYKLERSIGVTIVVSITTIISGDTKLSLSIPLDIPMFIIIRATSPREIIPTPIREESLKLNPRVLEVIKQATNLLNNAPVNKIIVNTITLLLNEDNVVCIPILAKNIGENIK